MWYLSNGSVIFFIVATPNHYEFGPRKHSIILTRWKCSQSFLIYDLCTVDILNAFSIKKKLTETSFMGPTLQS